MRLIKNFHVQKPVSGRRAYKKSRKCLTLCCPRIIIGEGIDEVGRDNTRTKAEKSVPGGMWTNRNKPNTMSKETQLIYKKEAKLAVRYVYKKETIKLPKWFCKQCFYAWVARQEHPPQKCANYHGYTDEHGVKHPACASRHWDEWKSDFNPETCTSSIALSVWYEEQAEKADRLQSQLRAVSE